MGTLSEVERAVDVAVEDRYPLTPTQTGMLFHRLLDRRSGVDVQQLVCTLDESVQIPAFRNAWRRVIAQHPILRAAFRWEGVSEPLLEVAAHVDLPWSDESGDLETYLQADRERGFELDRPPLMRFALFPQRSFVWTFHQALLDGPSLALVLADVVEESRASRPTFRDYVDWLRARETSEAFWRETLRGFTAPTPLPYARPSAEGWGEVELTTSASHTEVLAAWALLLGRYSGENDVVFGVAQSRRPPELDGAVGMFINTVPLRVRIASDMPAPAWLAQLQTQLDALEEHAYASLVSIQKWSDVPPGAQLFETLVMLETSTARDTGPLHDVRLHERTTYPLTLTVASDSIRVAYDRGRIDDDTIARLTGHFTTLLAHLHDEQPLAKLPILTADERWQLLIDWNDTSRDYPLEQGVHQLFETQAAQTPDRIAVTFEGESLTYRELDRRGNQIAHRLQALGVVPDTFVGILLERSTDLVAALLGILKAGGAYVPLDPMYPVDRLAYMLEDSRAPVLVTQTSLAELIPGHSATPVILDRGWEQSATESDEPVQVALRGEHLAYVIYTSGSTGKPKGVQIPHRAAVNFLYSMREQPGLTADDILLGVTTLSFDIAGLEIYLPLMIGARLELVSRETAADGRRLAEELVRSGATVLQATPATWRMLLEAGWQGDANLKILCGGEALSADLARQLTARVGALWNMYGPTETTIWSTVNHVDRVDGTTVSIGRPIANTDIYLLDNNLQPVPVGVSGELHIGGTGLARGYLNRPDLTAERFITDPFGRAPGARLYKTGDAARYLPDGKIEYLNRLDNQVKLRGYRIELGEIEAALRKHAGVNEAVVVVRSDTGAKVLAAYLIPQGSAPSAAELREFLKESLPEYMVPSFFVMVEAYPLTPNGKVDRKALPPPERTARDVEETFVAPRDPLETQLAEIWSGVLGVPKVGIRDNFFELGGESILALRMFVQIEQTFGRKLPLATLLQASTVEELAKALRDEGPARGWSPLVPLQTGGSKRPFFCIHGVGGNILNYRALAQHLGPDQPFYALQARGLDGNEQPITSLQEMVRVYLEEVRRVQPRGPYLLGGMSFGGVAAFEMALQLQEVREEVALVALFDSMPIGYTRFAGDESITARVVDGGFVRRMQVHLGILWHGPDRLKYLKKKVRRVWRKVVYRSWQTVYAVFRRLGKPLPKAMIDVQQANYLALRDYHPRVYSKDVVLFYAEAEPPGFTKEKRFGWSLLAAGGVSTEQVPGDHLTMLDEPHVRTLARTLAAHLDQSTRRPSTPSSPLIPHHDPPQHEARVTP
ncbi:MAG TPA: amino acid adenylation domain-containing protein [Thermoanaerobaculia bacterium]